MRNRLPDEFPLAAGVRALYNAGRHDERPSTVRVVMVNTGARTASVVPCLLDKLGTSYPMDPAVAFTVPLRTLLPPLRVYAQRSLVWCALHRPWRWRFVDTWADYEARGLLVNGELSPEAEEHGDYMATAAIAAALQADEPAGMKEAA